MEQNKQEHNMCKTTKIQQDFITKKKNKVMTRNIPKTNIEHIKGNEEIYLYLYPLCT